MTVLPAVLSQHAEDAAFNWVLRDLAVHEAHYSLRDLADLDDRVEAHLDGLRIAGDMGWEILKEELRSEEAGEVFAAASIAFDSGDPPRVEGVLATVCDSVELSRGLISALGWLPFDVAREHLNQLLQSEDPSRRRVGIGGTAVHRADPGDALTKLLTSGETPAKSRALRAAGELGRTDVSGHCRTALESEDEEERFWAAWSATLLGDRNSAIRVLFTAAQEGGSRAEQAADLVARSMPSPQVLVWQRQLAEDGEHARLACKVAGVLGDTVVVPWLIEMMGADEVARPAGEAFTSITGVDLAFEDLEREWPEGFEAGPTESPEDEDVELDTDENLAWPDPELIGSWWDDNGSRFSAGTRYLLGKPITKESLGEALRTGMQRQRAAAALELALMDSGAPLFEVRARGDRQRKILGV
jgi:uncharacterized protein (TIGR02270 family)